ncbi:MAG: aromatic ring-hydroxylating dioxygenase subunit alpha [Pseudomonadota bacterium]
MLDVRAGVPPEIADELGALDDANRRAMPPAFYTSPDVLAAEIEPVFLSGWLCVGRADEVAKIGDYYTIEMMEEPLIVTRDKSGEVKVLANVCRHRGSRLIEGRGEAKKFTCPYHAWTYGLDGGLVRAPLIEGDLSECNLHVFRSEVWMGWIFVNLDGTAPSLADQLADLDPYVRNYHPEEMRAHNPVHETWDVNWKGLAENFMEGYHLTPVHLKTLHPMTPTKLCEKVPGGAAWTAYKAHFNPAFEGRTEVHPDMTEEECRLAMMFWVYPAFVVGLGPNSATTMSLQPDGPDRVRVMWDVATRAGMDPEAAQYRWDFAASFNAEDKPQIEDMQRGLRSRYATAGPLAPADYEGCIWDFYHWMAGRLLSR